MLKLRHIRRSIAEHIVAGPVGPYVDDYLFWLASEGYSRVGSRCQLQAVGRFNSWLIGQSLGICSVDEVAVERFVAGLRRSPSVRCPDGRLSTVASGVRRFARYLWECGFAARRSSDVPITEAGRWLSSYDDHLRQVQGLAQGSRDLYLSYARRFVEQRFAPHELAWSELTADDITQFVCRQAQQLKPSNCRAPISAIRAMLRYLVISNAVAPGLEGAVPSIRQWKLAGLPRYLSSEQVERALKHCQGTTIVALRDRAIVLLLARLAIRAGEVASLSVDDLNWHEGRVRIHGAKSGVERALPLSGEVGQALVEYLQARGPVAGTRSVFLGIGPRRRRSVSASTISAIARRALDRASIEVERPGAHVFRHTAATHMVRRGATFKEVADVLGHARIETTSIYAKLDFDALARVALPWPGAER